jgi:hypothetical protein
VIEPRALVERGPEKAGVGGSIPSLATVFSITYTHPKPWGLDRGR